MDEDTGVESQGDCWIGGNLLRDRAFELLNGSPVAGAGALDGISLPEYLRMVERVAVYLNDGTLPASD